MIPVSTLTKVLYFILFVFDSLFCIFTVCFSSTQFCVEHFDILTDFINPNLHVMKVFWAHLFSVLDVDGDLV